MADFVVISGLSGAGRSTAADVFEDLDWFVIDNLPPVLIPKVGELAAFPGSEIDRVVLVAGTGQLLEELPAAIDALRATTARVRVVFLEASDDALIRRYGSTRRPHPLSDEGVINAVTEERVILQPVKDKADLVIDTSELNVHQLRHRLNTLFADDEERTGMRVSVLSFGFKHGMPTDVDLVLDARFLPNPFWVPELRSRSGLDTPVREYVIGQPETMAFLENLESMLTLCMPAYEREGKAYLTVAIGCTGGRHRSVVLAEEIAKRIESHGYAPSVSHRDIARSD